MASTPIAEMFGAQKDEIVLSIGSGRPSSRKFLMCMFVAFIIYEIISVILIWAILWKLKSSSANYSKNTIRLHYQLTLLLAVQLFAPIIFITFPVFSAIYIAFSANQLSETYFKTSFLLVSLYCPFNSFLTVLFITPYRRYTLELIKHTVSAFVRFVSFNKYKLQVETHNPWSPPASEQVHTSGRRKSINFVKV